MMFLGWIPPGAMLLLLVFLALSAMRLVQQDERDVIFVLGRMDVMVPLIQSLHHQANVPVQEPVNGARRSKQDESLARETVGTTEA